MWSFCSHGNFFFLLSHFWGGNSFYCISEILGSKHFLVTLEMCMETWNIIPFHFMGIYNNLKYLIYSIKYLKITIFTTYITLEFFSVVVIRNCDISTEIDLCLDMVIFKILIEHIKYLGMLYNYTPWNETSWRFKFLYTFAELQESV